MKGGIVEINWHDSQPVLTLDFHPKSGLLATGGNDRDIKLWVISPCEPQKKVPRASYQSSLSYHGSAVNTLRFSPSGEQLASGADGGELVIWKLHSMDDGDNWKILKRLLHHQKDVLDLQWSNDGAFLISGSVDNLCIVWDVNKGSAHQVMDAHLHYVQGVAWDPLGCYIASLSSDRTCRIYAKKSQNKSKASIKTTYVCQHVLSKIEPQMPDASKAPSTKAHLFHDETLPSFFRRLAWSPDGSFLLVPAGVQKFSPALEAHNTAYIFSRKDLTRPAIQLPGSSKPIVAVRFCPILFEKRGSASAGFFKLPYRVVFAIASLNSVYVYDTESDPPIAIFAGLHYAAITDIAWSADGKYLAVSSRDCYCTLVEFENDELGSPICPPDKVDANMDLTASKPNNAPNLKIDDVDATGADTLITSKSNGETPKLYTANENSTKESDKVAEQNVNVTSKLEVSDMEVDNVDTSVANTAVAGMQLDVQKPALHTPSENSTKSKPGKKRITPIAIT